ncbi:methyltransferase domain-containing protein [Amycolatopsis taiwanensis]|uniref:methyltransferase domain-containing protein n=1 Tax=Amycolatopsis taiwanensis TaxID=342230 RepID=UPI000484382D|nr:methyltransferase domain-containing protein [Amycolatopsis taiwanensis]
MQEKPGTFDTAVAAWQRWQEAPWGRLRYTQAEANLACHLDSLGSPPLRVLDLGGGDGGDAIRLAMKGCHVTIADYAPAMLAAAEQRAAEAGVADRVTCNDPIAARAALDTDQARTHTFGTAMILRTADEVGYVLDELGCPVTGHYGISSVCHYMTDDERKQDPVFYAELERLELAVADRLPYLHTARFFHLIGQTQFG